jgi:hypothetical protein
MSDSSFMMHSKLRALLEREAIRTYQLHHVRVYKHAARAYGPNGTHIGGIPEAKERQDEGHKQSRLGRNFRLQVVVHARKSDVRQWYRMSLIGSSLLYSRYCHGVSATSSSGEIRFREGEADCGYLAGNNRRHRRPAPFYGLEDDLPILIQFVTGLQHAVSVM